MKFRLTEEKKIKNMADVVNTLLNNFEKMTENEILDLTQEGITSTIEDNAPMFISPNGSIIDVKKLTGLATPMHLDFIYDLLYYKLNEIDNELSMDDITEVDESIEAEELEYLSDKGWIRLNPGTASVEKRFYCVLPFKDAIKPTERQYDILKDFIEYGIERNKKQLLIYYGDSAKWYNLQDEEAEDIINEIKRYYAGFNESLNEVFDANGELYHPDEYRNIKINDNFKKWFKDGGITNAYHDPLIVYHGSRYDFDYFIPSKSSIDFPDAVYFTDNKKIAETYGNTKPYFIRMQKPYYINAHRKSFNDFYDEMALELNQAFNSGYDGIIIKDIKDDSMQTGSKLVGTTYVIFDSYNIKSINNNGNWDSNTNNVYEATQINEVYPNKGESKKDFISRFMSVTKDEYPDVKQRYAVSLQYWNRKDKKK